MRTLGSPHEVKHSVFNNRVYFKDSLNDIVIRTKDVNRTSGKVIAKNELFASKAKDLILACRDRPWDEYIACLRSKAKDLGLGDGSSKKPEYRKRFWKHPPS
ncbi:MAG: hypothetical protein JRD89_04830 [Deltaproteobacteria bacterium]|nr:hypothetical protein [Deltaproteobacteria bacterium]